MREDQFRCFYSVGLQMSAIVVELAEPFATLCTTVRPLTGVLVHVVLQLHVGGQLKTTHTTVVITCAIKL
jgi:hypothetical protein